MDESAKGSIMHAVENSFYFASNKYRETRGGVWKVR